LISPAFSVADHEMRSARRPSRRSQADNVGATAPHRRRQSDLDDQRLQQELHALDEWSSRTPRQ
jgi:hypothetical protein